MSSIDRKVTARTGAAGVLVGAAITLGVVGWMNNTPDRTTPANRIDQVVSSTTDPPSTATTLAPVSTAAPVIVPPATTPPPALDQRVTTLEGRVDQLEVTTTTTMPPTTTTVTPSTVGPGNG